jgi:diguanylate cyclase (GGDEF)-like protein/PAS domain S-box-containing protein
MLMVADAPPERFEHAVQDSLGLLAGPIHAVGMEFALGDDLVVIGEAPDVGAPVVLGPVREAMLATRATVSGDVLTATAGDPSEVGDLLRAAGLSFAVTIPVVRRGELVASLASAWAEPPLSDSRIIGALEVYAHLLVTDQEQRVRLQRQRDRDVFARAVLRHSPAVIARWNRDLRIEFVNDAVEDVSGLPTSWFIGRNADDLGWTGEARARWEAATSTVLGTAHAVTFLFDVPVRGRGRRVYSTQVGPLYADDERTIAGLVSIASDVTEFLGMVHELEEDRELLGALIDDSPDVILRVDGDGLVVFANEAWRRTFGGVIDDPIGRRAAEVARLLGRADGLEQAVADAFSVGRAAVDVWRLPEALGGGWVEARVVPERDGGVHTEHVLVLVRDVTQAHLDEEVLLAAAGSDPLTGLANRRVLLDATRRQLATAERSDRTVAVLYVDIDHFKDVNDAFGHRAGDELLRAVGERFVSVVRPADLVGRQGGDEFIVVVSGIASAQEVDSVARRLLASLDASIDVAGLPVQVSASIGVAVARETATTDAEDLLRQADLALYEAKRAGRNRFVHFEADQGDEARHRTVLAELLDDAVGRGELSAYLQPEVDTRTGRVVAVEALARWCRPGRPPAPAQAFLDLVHDHHVQAAIDLAVVEQAAAAMAELDHERPGAALDLRVNLARETLRHPGIADTRVAIFASSGIDSERVTVEFDNRELSALAPVELEVLEQVHAAGFAVGIDNVELPERFDIDPARRLRVGRIAIIPSVVAQLGDDELADALFAGVVVALERLGITVTVVGVEDAEQAELARSLGIHAQGRWFGAAGPVGAMGAMLDRLDDAPEPGAVGPQDGSEDTA